MLLSSVCTRDSLASPEFQQWVLKLRERPGHMHRKIWEWCYIAQALHERDLLQPGKRGLGFAVGQEPLAALFASFGCDIVATDLDTASAQQSGWSATNQHADSLEKLNQRGICSPEEFTNRVAFRFVNMNHIPQDLTGFDFVWSSCSIEHLGSLKAGQLFMQNMMQCLKPGGVAIHTTEFNVSSNRDTWSHGHDVIFRKCDLLQMKRRLESLGHHVASFDFHTGNHPDDLHVDVPPYTHEPHLKLQLGHYVSTSIGIIATAGQKPSWLRRKRVWLQTKLFG